MTETFAALAEPNRFRIVELLHSGPCPVNDIGERLQLSQPLVSKHLRVLKEAGLVLDTRDGTRRIYRVDPSGLAGIRAYFDSFWDEALGRFAAEARKERE